MSGATKKPSTLVQKMGDGGEEYQLSGVARAELVEAIGRDTRDPHRNPDRKTVTEFWIEMGDRLGFVWSTVRNIRIGGMTPGCDDGDVVQFTADPKALLPERDDRPAARWAQGFMETDPFKLGGINLETVTESDLVEVGRQFGLSLIEAWHAGRADAVREWAAQSMDAAADERRQTEARNEVLAEVRPILADAALACRVKADENYRSIALFSDAQARDDHRRSIKMEILVDRIDAAVRGIPLPPPPSKAIIEARIATERKGNSASE